MMHSFEFESASQVEQAKLFDFILTQTSLNGRAPYDLIEGVITQSINQVKALNLNAKIANVVLNIEGQLCFLQIYTERKNGFVATQAQFGTDPTEYIVQIRFPYGLEIGIGERRVLIPSGDFQNVLQPYLAGEDQVRDDVTYDTKREELILGDGVRVDQRNDQVFFYCAGTAEPQLVIDYHVYTGSGYERLRGDLKEYWKLSDYAMRLKLDGLYPIFYSNALDQSSASLLRTHDYQGYTELQLSSEQATHRDYGAVAFESADANFPQADADFNYDEFNCVVRKQRYRDLARRMDNQFRGSLFGQQCLRNQATMSDAGVGVGYVLNLSIINGVTLLRNYGLPVIRLRAYQLALLQCCIQFSKHVSEQTLCGSSGSIDMGVGAGKTFFTYTLLQELNDAIKHHRLALPPPYCMAPNAAVAGVTAKTINRQGIKTGTAATLITHGTHIPTLATLEAYNRISQQAMISGRQVHHYMHVELQNLILNHCRQHNLHPYTTINLLYGTQEFKLFKESIDPNRLLLIVEGQKSLMRQTGMLSIEALRNFSEQLTAIQKGLEDVRARVGFVFPSAARSSRIESIHLSMIYDQSIQFNPQIYDKSHISHENSGYFSKNSINFFRINQSQFYDFLKAKYKSNRRKIRDTLVKIACLHDLEAALLLANSGGLGNTYSEEEMEQQINRLLPKAYAALNQLVHKSTPRTLLEDMTLYRYLNEILVSLDGLSIKQSRLYNDALEREILAHVLHQHLELIKTVQNSVAEQLAAIPNISIQDAITLAPYDLSPEANSLDVANQMAGVMALRVSDNPDLRRLQLTHIPVFTAEGFAAHIEALAGLEGEPVFTVSESLGLYGIHASDDFITSPEIAIRLKDLLRTIMLADEVHKEEFRFLFDESDHLHQRISAVTQKYLGHPFSRILPNRIGMSGTINEVALEAFPGRSLYTLSTQKMIQNNLTKRILIERINLDPMELGRQNRLSVVAEKIVMTYLRDDNKVSFVSRALLFSKTQNTALNTAIQDVFLQISQNSDTECVRQLSQTLPSGVRLAEQQRLAFRDYLFALYLEYVLSKSNTPKECSDLIGLQNKLFYTETDLGQLSMRRLVDIQALQEDDIGRTLLSSLTHVNPTSLTQADARLFMRQKMPNAALQEAMVQIISTHKNHAVACVRAIDTLSRSVSCEALITTDRRVLESGTAMLMLGTEDERTGYSHEPVGIILDIPSNIDNMLQLNRLIANLSTLETASLLFDSLHQLTLDTYSYDEKNQAGGRALRTPIGRARLLEYPSDISDFLAITANSHRLPLQLLRVETSFADIFVADEQYAQAARASIEFNRTLIQLLQESGAEFTLAMAMHSIQQKFSRKLSDRMTEDQYRNYIEQRLPLAWAMKYQPECATAYFRTLEQSGLPELQGEWWMPFIGADALYQPNVAEHVWPEIGIETGAERPANNTSSPAPVLGADALYLPDVAEHVRPKIVIETGAERSGSNTPSPAPVQRVGEDGTSGEHDAWRLRAICAVFSIILTMIALLCTIIALSAAFNGLSVVMLGFGTLTVKTSPIILGPVAAFSSVASAASAYRTAPNGFFAACSRVSREDGAGHSASCFNII